MKETFPREDAPHDQDDHGGTPHDDDDIEAKLFAQEWWFRGESDLLWAEDRCTVDRLEHERVGDAWRRIFGEEYRPSWAIDDKNVGDSVTLLFDYGVVVFGLTSPGEDEIRLLRNYDVPEGKICSRHREAFSRWTGECSRCPSKQLTLAGYFTEELSRQLREGADEERQVCRDWDATIGDGLDDEDAEDLFVGGQDGVSLFDQLLNEEIARAIVLNCF